MAFPSLCFYEKQVADNNWSDTPTYFLVNVALVCYCASSEGRSFSSLRVKTGGRIWGSFSFLQGSHTAVSSVSTEPARPAHSMRGGILNCPQGAQLLGSSRYCFWHSLYIFSYWRSSYNTNLLRHNPRFSWSLERQSNQYWYFTGCQFILFCSRESTFSPKPSQQEKIRSSETSLLVRVYPYFSEAQFPLNWINRYPKWDVSRWEISR